MERFSVGRSFLKCLFILILVFHTAAFAVQPTSLRQPHPLNWMYGLPTGEMPGWNGDSWFSLDISHSNIWNAPLKMQNLKTGANYDYTADYEQLTAIAEFGMPIYERLALSIEIPYAYRSGGFFDGFIQGVHSAFGNRDFNRPQYGRNEYTYSVKTNGTDYYHDDNLNGVANIKPKLKLWLLQWGAGLNGACPCGLSISGQYNIPVGDEKSAGTTGHGTVSGLLHIGAPIGESSAIWLTGAYTRLADNPAMKGWPLMKDHYMYEVNTDFALSDEWGLLFMVRTESPFLDVDSLSYVDTETDPIKRSRNRGATGWNSLVHWQGAEALGLRYRPSESLQFNFYAVEDWGLGPYDTGNDQIFSNGAPDINFVIQMSKTL